MKFLQHKQANIAIIVITTIVCSYLYRTSGVLDGVPISSIFLNWLPLFIGSITLIFYLMSRLITEKYGWILTVLCVLINVFLVIITY